MLLANYGSDSDSDNESASVPGPSKPPQAAAAPAKPAPVKKKKGPVKITLDLPKPSNGDDDGDESKRAGSISEEEREVKKPKLAGAGGKGSSALLGMLPAPKRKLPVKSDSKPGSSLAVNKSMAAKPKVPVPVPEGMEGIGLTAVDGLGGDVDDEGEGKSGMMVPPSLRGKSKAKKEEEPSIDLFGLSAPSSAATPLIPRPGDTPKPTAITSAPSVPDFVPPEPTVNDPYPGYYQLPSGSWAAYDAEYYHSFFADQNAQAGETSKTNAGDGRVGRHWEEYNSRGADLVDVDVGKGLEEGRAQAEKDEMTKRPKMNTDDFEYKAVGQTKGLAAQRHQLTSLLNSAYSQREELEDRIAQNSKSMRLARQKYGF